MKKNGFTLAEVLIAMAIIGIVSALTAPAISNLLPDRNKMKVLKYSKIIKDINGALLSDSSIYMKENDCIGLSCTAAPMEEKYKNYSGNDKYVNLVAAHLETATDLSKSVLSNSASPFNTTDGATWTITYTPSSNSGKIVIDINGSDTAPNCMYPACNKPDIYQFNIDAYGNVSGGDGLTRAYLENPANLNDRKKDLENAAKLGNSSDATPPSGSNDDKFENKKPDDVGNKDNNVFDNNNNNGGSINGEGNDPDNFENKKPDDTGNTDNNGGNGFGDKSKFEPDTGNGGSNPCDTQQKSNGINSECRDNGSGGNSGSGNGNGNGNNGNSGSGTGNGNGGNSGNGSGSGLGSGSGGGSVADKKLGDTSEHKYDDTFKKPDQEESTIRN